MYTLYLSLFVALPDFLVPRGWVPFGLSTKDCNLCDGPTLEVHDSQSCSHSTHAQSQIWLADKNMKWLLTVYAQKSGPSQMSRFLVLTYCKSAWPLGMRIMAWKKRRKNWDCCTESVTWMTCADMKCTNSIKRVNFLSFYYSQGLSNLGNTCFFNAVMQVSSWLHIANLHVIYTLSYLFVALQHHIKCIWMSHGLYFGKTKLI